MTSMDNLIVFGPLLALVAGMLVVLVVVEITS
jgi:hypothetical protein